MKNLKELKKEYEKNKKNILQEEQLKKEIAGKTDTEPTGFYISDLFGSSGNVKFYSEFRGERATEQQLKKLLKTFKPYKRFIVQSGCCDVSHAEVTDKERENEEVTQINPVIIQYQNITEEEVTRCNTYEVITAIDVHTLFQILNKKGIKID